MRECTLTALFRQQFVSGIVYVFSTKLILPVAYIIEFRDVLFQY